MALRYALSFQFFVTFCVPFRTRCCVLVFVFFPVCFFSHGPLGFIVFSLIGLQPFFLCLPYPPCPYCFIPLPLYQFSILHPSVPCLILFCSYVLLAPFLRTLCSLRCVLSTRFSSALTFLRPWLWSGYSTSVDCSCLSFFSRSDCSIFCVSMLVFPLFRVTSTPSWWYVFVVWEVIEYARLAIHSRGRCFRSKAAVMFGE